MNQEGYMFKFNYFLLLPVLASVGFFALTESTRATVCTDKTLVVIARPDDALAFMHDTVTDRIDAGGCVKLVSMTSYYDNNVVISGREEGARAMYEYFNRGFEDGNPVTFPNAALNNYAGVSVWEYPIFGDDRITLAFFRRRSTGSVTLVERCTTTPA